MKPQDKKKVIQFFEKRLERYGDSYLSLEWASPESQAIRYRVLKDIGELNEASILDVGCGFGDLYGYLKEEGLKFNYTGYDISPKLIQIAKKKHPQAKFEAKDILEDKVERSFDYVLCCGALNIKISNHEQFVKGMIRKMWELAEIGLGFNLLSIYGSPGDAVHYYADPEDIFSYCKTLTNWVTLRHDYLPHDFTIFMYKMKPFI